MKRLLPILFLLVFATASFGQTFSNIGIGANPWIPDPSYNINTTTSGTVEYWAYWNPISPTFDDPYIKIQLFFGTSTIFSSAAFNGIVSAPSGWSGPSVGYDIFSSGYLELSGPATTGEMKFRVNYGLNNPANMGGWSSGAPWSQNFMVYSGDSGLANAGSSYLVPEPTTLLLLGLGFFGLGIYKTIKKK